MENLRSHSILRMFLLVLIQALFHLITLVYYSEVHGSRRMNLQLPIRINAAGPIRSPLRTVSSDSSLYVGHFRLLRSNYDVSGSIGNYSFSDPSTPKVLFDGEWSDDESRNTTSYPPPFPVDSSEEELLSSTVKSSSSSSSTRKSPESSKDPIQVKNGGKAKKGLALISNLSAENKEVKKLNRKVVSDCLVQSLRNAGQPNLGDRGSSSRQLIHIRHDWPCLLAPSLKTANPPATNDSELVVKPDSVVAPDYNSHPITNGEGSSSSFQPVTFCSVHKNAGYLKLEDIEKSEYYTRVEVHLPSMSKVTHRYNGCVLEFPPSDASILNNEVAAVDGDDEDMSTPVPELPEMDETSSSRSLHNRFCLDCGRRLSSADLYLYRHMAFCSDDCRFFNTLETAVMNESIETVNLEDEEENAFETQEGSSSSSPPPPSGSKDKGKGILYIG